MTGNNKTKLIETNSMDKLGIYHMSGIGCQRALAAEKLGYDPTPEREGGELIMKEASLHEGMVKDRMREAGISIEEGGMCEACLKEFGNERKGIHVELTTPLIRAVGHLDGKIYFNHEYYPLEIKAFGRFTWDKFRKEQLDYSIAYKNQAGVYIAAVGKPGVYIVKNRDNGQLLIYTIHYFGEGIPQGLIELLRPIAYRKEVVSLPEIPVEPILDKLNWIELSVREGDLPVGDCDKGSSECRWCHFRYLCIDEDKDKDKDKGEGEGKGKVKEQNSPSLLEAADLWVQGTSLRKQGEDWREAAKLTFIEHAKTNDISKFRTGGVSISYKGTRTKSVIDEELLKQLVSKDILKQIYKTSKPWDNIQIRILKGGI